MFESIYSVDKAVIGRKCQICGDVFPLEYGDRDPRTFCDECAKRLHDKIYFKEETLEPEALHEKKKRCLSRKAKFKYSCDGGCAVFGVHGFRVKFPNDYGDGTHNLVVLHIGSGEKKPNGAHYTGVIEGDEILLYDYDCYPEKDWESGVMGVISGTYYVYVDGGDIYLEEWRR